MAFADLFALDYVKTNYWDERLQEVGEPQVFLPRGTTQGSAGRLVEVTRQLGELLANLSRKYTFFQFLGMEKSRGTCTGILPRRDANRWRKRFSCFVVN